MIPTKTFEAGWPERLTDNEGKQYVRLRDGQPHDEFSGEACLYALLDGAGYIDRAHQWIPHLGATLDNMSLSGGSWMSAEELLRYGQHPIELPEEPVTL